MRSTYVTITESFKSTYKNKEQRNNPSYPIPYSEFLRKQNIVRQQEKLRDGCTIQALREVGDQT